MPVLHFHSKTHVFLKDGCQLTFPDVFAKTLQLALLPALTVHSVRMDDVEHQSQTLDVSSTEPPMKTHVQEAIHVELITAEAIVFLIVLPLTEYLVLSILALFLDQMDVMSEPFVFLTIAMDALATSLIQPLDKKSAMNAATLNVELVHHQNNAQMELLEDLLEDASEEETEDVHGKSRNVLELAL